VAGIGSSERTAVSLRQFAAHLRQKGENYEKNEKGQDPRGGRGLTPPATGAQAFERRTRA